MLIIMEYTHVDLSFLYGSKKIISLRYSERNIQMLFLGTALSYMSFMSIFYR